MEGGSNKSWNNNYSHLRLHKSSYCSGRLVTKLSNKLYQQEFSWV